MKTKHCSSTRTTTEQILPPGTKVGKFTLNYSKRSIKTMKSMSNSYKNRSRTNWKIHFMTSLGQSWHWETSTRCLIKWLSRRSILFLPRRCYFSKYYTPNNIRKACCIQWFFKRIWMKQERSRKRKYKTFGFWNIILQGLLENKKNLKGRTLMHVKI